MATNPLDLIEKKESGGRNVYQELVPRSVSSASGYYQMIKPTWHRWANAVGIDTKKYPEAITAPRELQRKAAEYGFETEGFRPWEATKNLVGQEKKYDTKAPSVPLPPQRPGDTSPASTPKTAETPQTPLPNSPLPESATAEQLRGILTQDDPFAKLAEERAAEERTAQQVASAAAAARQQQPAPQPPPAPVMPPIAPPVDYSALLLPRLKRGLLAESGYGGLLG